MDENDVQGLRDRTLPALTHTFSLSFTFFLAFRTNFQNFGDMPSEAAGRYGDRKFTMMMMAKVLCVQMVSTLKYNILFQDVDIVWYKNPIPFFEEKDTDLQEFDMLFQVGAVITVIVVLSVRFCFVLRLRYLMPLIQSLILSFRIHY